MEIRDDETVLFEGHPSWRSIVGFSAGGVAAALVAGIGVGAAASTGIGSSSAP